MFNLDKDTKITYALTGKETAEGTVIYPGHGGYTVKLGEKYTHVPMDCIRLVLVEKMYTVSWIVLDTGTPKAEAFYSVDQANSKARRMRMRGNTVWVSENDVGYWVPFH